MVEIIAHIFLFGLLFMVIYQDWKIRAVHVLIFPLLFISSLYFLSLSEMSPKSIGMNLLFILVLIGCLYSYLSIKHKKFIHFFKEYFGLGDLLFLVAITPLFTERNFVLFVITGTLLTLLVESVLIHYRKEKTNPFAGYLAKYLLVIKSCSLLFSIDLFYSTIL